MAQNLDLNVNVKTTGTENIGNIRKDIKEANAELIKAQKNFGDYSNEAIQAAKKVAELKDKIAEARETADLFDPGKKFQALTGVLSTVAGGFGAVQGAMALFGKESEEVQKTLLKVQSAMALSQGLSQIRDGAKDFSRLGTIIRLEVVSAFSTLRGAIIATGVGALVVGLGLLVANFQKVKQVINDLFPSLGEFADKVKLIVQGFTDFIGVTSEAKRNAEALTEATNAYIKSADRIIRELESQNGKEKEIYDAKRDRIQKQLSLIKGATAEELQAIADLNTEIKILDNQEAKRKQKIADDAEAARKKEEADEKARLEKARADARAYEQFDTELQQRLMELDEERAEKKRALDFQSIQNLITDLDYENDLLDNDFKEDQQRLANKEAYIAEQKAIELSNLELTERERLEIIAKYAKQEQDIDKDITNSKRAEQEAQVAMQLQYLGFAEQAGNLLSQIAGKNKSLAIAGLLIEKGAAIAKIITQMNTVPAILPPGIPNPAFIPSRIGGALSIASVIAASVNGIQQINQAGSGGTGTSSVPAISTQAPMVPQLPTAQITQLNQQSINDLGNQAVRAYVIETDVTGNQQRMAAIKQRARFS
jgi:hypothetical protein